VQRAGNYNGETETNRSEDKCRLFKIQDQQPVIRHLGFGWRIKALHQEMTFQQKVIGKPFGLCIKRRKDVRQPSPCSDGKGRSTSSRSMSRAAGAKCLTFSGKIADTSLKRSACCAN